MTVWPINQPPSHRRPVARDGLYSPRFGNLRLAMAALAIGLGVVLDFSGGAAAAPLVLPSAGVAVPLR